MVDEATRDGRSPSRFDRWASWIIAAGTWITVVNRLSYDERSAFWFQITVTMAVLLTAFAIYTEVKFRCARRLSGAARRATRRRVAGRVPAAHKNVAASLDA